MANRVRITPDPEAAPNSSKPTVLPTMSVKKARAVVTPPMITAMPVELRVLASTPSSAPPLLRSSW